MTNRSPFWWMMAATSAFSITAFASEPWTLDRALEYALGHSPDARIAQHRIAAARAGLDQANAAFWPQLQFQSGYSRTDQPASVFGSVLNQRAFSPSLNFNDVPDIDQLNLRGSITVPLYNGGRNLAARNSAEAQAAAARHQAEAVRHELSFEVVRAYHTVLKAREFVRATAASVGSFENNRTIATHRFQAGTLLKADLLDLEVRLARAQEDLARARNAQGLAERALRNLLGLEQGDLAIADTAPAMAAPPLGDFLARAELAAARERERAAQAEVRRAQGGYQPRVQAFTSVDYDRGWKLNGSGESYTAGLLLQWDLWDGRATRARVNEARAHLEATREAERKLRLALDFEVEQARLQLREATERLAVTDKVIAQAAESVSLTRARFEQGLALATQLIDAETALTTARVGRAEAEADRHIAVAALRKAFGRPQLDSSTSP